MQHKEEALLLPLRRGRGPRRRPPGFEIDPKIIETAKSNAKASGSELEVTNDLDSALEGAHAVLPRNWASNELLMVGAESVWEREGARVCANAATGL